MPASFNTPDGESLASARSAMFTTYAPPELVFERGEGPYLYDIHGEAYLDFIAGIAVSALGHSHPRLEQALIEQAKKVWHVSNLFRVPQGESLAKRLAELSGLDRVFFTNSGTESVECGLKMMRRYHYDHGAPERNRIIGAHSAFHGRTFAAICAAGNPAHVKGFVRDDEGYDHVPFNDLEAVEAAITEKTAGIIVEPIQGEGGIGVAEKAYLQGLRTLADKHNILLMFDEVQCGVGRTGQFYAAEYFGVRPDIIASAKGLGGGFPVGACIANEKVASSMVVGTHGSTYGGNPLAMRVAAEVVEIISDKQFLRSVTEKGEKLKQGLLALCEDFPTVIDGVRGVGLMLGLHCVQDNGNTDLLVAARTNKLLLGKAGDNVVRLLPPLIIDESHIAEALEKLRLSLHGLAQGQS